jgi:copper/silver efflux system protein
LLTLIVIPAIFGIVKGFRLPSDERFESLLAVPVSKPTQRPERAPEPAE